MRKTTLVFVFFLTLLSCNNRIQHGDEIFLNFSIENEARERIDDNLMPSGDTLPVRIIVGEGFLLPEVETQIIGMKRNEIKEFTIEAENAYASRGVHYLNNSDTVYIIRPGERLKVFIETL